MMKIVLALVLLIFIQTSTSAQPREEIALTDGWKFSLSQKMSETPPSVDSDKWQTVSIPHDWSWEAGPRKNGAQGGGGGFRIGGVGWYRNQFKLPDAFNEKRVLIHFDGAFRNAAVFLNGHQFETHPYGFLSFTHDLTSYLQPGLNTLEVRCDCSKEPASRWYHPCGIFAPVRIEATPKTTFIVNDGIAITTPKVTDGEARVDVKFEVEGVGDKDEKHHFEVGIFSPSGEKVGETISTTRVGTTKGEARITFSDPLRWSVENPQLYTAVVSITKPSTNQESEFETVDQIRIPFGIRTIRWDAETGFFLNEQPVKLNGVCEHLTGGPVGGAWTEELLEWKLKRLKAMGCNAIRTAHNPQTPAFYRICDRLGILVMDEIFDGWGKKANKDYGALNFKDWWRRDVKTWVRRDRNHPCVIIYSVGNETHGGVAAELVKVVRENDPTRLVTSGQSGTKHMDVIGMNGGSERKSFFSSGPLDRAFVATEATHTWQVRGFYKSRTWYRDGISSKRQGVTLIPDLTEKEIFTAALMPREKMANKKQIFLSSYDNATVRISARHHWEHVRDLPWIAGAFRWTGFDYPGESTYVHGGLPFHAFAGGTHDLAGFEKDLAWFYRSQWTTKPMVHILPHWTHHQMELGTEIPVQVYSNAEEVELLLNGKSLGTDRPGTKALEMQCQWMVPWETGELIAIAKTGGKEVARQRYVTASQPAGLLAKVDPTCPNHAIITFDTVDAEGNFQPYGENPIFTALSGDARLMSFENGHPADMDLPVADHRRAFMGKARLFLHSPSQKYQLLAGAILGQRRQLQSNLVTIDLLSIVDGQQATLPAQEIRYTTDGSEPSADSELYQQPIEVPATCTVKAAVFSGEKLLLEMEESFGPDLGLHWGSANAEPVDEGSATALQAETAEFNRAKVSKDGSGFRGTGFLDFKGQQDTVEFYQENDGPPGAATLVIRYAHDDPSGVRQLDLSLNGKNLDTVTFKSTGSWNSKWREVSVPVKIQAGANILKLKTLKKAGPNLDEIEFR